MLKGCHLGLLSNLTIVWDYGKNDVEIVCAPASFNIMVTLKQTSYDLLWVKE